MAAPRYYSQLNQDRTIAEVLLPGKTDGWFVEAGAHDGVNFSNTKALEDLGWKGLCVEAMPETFKELCKNRTCHCEQYALYDQSGVVLDFTVESTVSGLMSGITKHLNGPHFKYVINKTVIPVTTSTLTDLLDKNQAPNVIDYFSLDVEGAEQKVLEGIDWDKYTFSVINVEHNFEEPDRSNIRSYLEARGYKFYKQEQWDDWYTGPNFTPPQV